MDYEEDNLVCVKINNNDVYFEVHTEEERMKVLKGW